MQILQHLRLSFYSNQPHSMGGKKVFKSWTDQELDFKYNIF